MRVLIRQKMPFEAREADDYGGFNHPETWDGTRIGI